ncbi:MAG: hypothetical protein KDA25_11305 [Phycisphaerales bacterium]|nr:hypothetical protein [Phycisphaerales bacterium]
MARFAIIVGVTMLGGAALAPAGPVLGSDFASGDLYVVSPALPHPTPPPTALSGVMRVDPVSGATAIIASLRFIQGRTATYDPYRDRIIVSTGSLRQIDAAGDVTDLATPFGNVNDVAPTGDGRLYLLGLTGVAPIGVIDAAGATHDLLDTDGRTPFTIALTAGLGRCIYDISTNALFVADPLAPGTRIRRVPLTVDGMQVAGPIDETVYNASLASADEPTQWSAGPGGSLFLKVDDNSNSLQARMLLVNPVTLDVVPYASSSYFGVAGEVAGTYSSARDQAVVLDSLSDHLRVFAFGESGAGAIFASPVSSSGSSGETARVLSIGDTIGGGTSGSPADLDGDGDVDAADLAILLSRWGPCVGCGGDLDGDGDVDAADLAILLGAWS